MALGECLIEFRTLNLKITAKATKHLRKTQRSGQVLFLMFNRQAILAPALFNNFFFFFNVWSRLDRLQVPTVLTGPAGASLRPSARWSVLGAEAEESSFPPEIRLGNSVPTGVSLSVTLPAFRSALTGWMEGTCLVTIRIMWFFLKTCFWLCYNLHTDYLSTFFPVFIQANNR